MLKTWSILLGLLVLASPVAQAQFSCITNADGMTVTITGYSGTGGDVTIPATTNGLAVTSIGQAAFRSMSSLTSVTIPGTVTDIGFDAFFGCTSLTSVAIPGSVTRIETNAFEGCIGLTNAMIANGVGSIEENAFSHSGLISLTLPGSVTNLGVHAFNPCSNLASVVIPGSVTSIPVFAFGNCTHLTNVTIANGVTSITIPGSVTNVGVQAFTQCSSLSNVYFTGNAPSFPPLSIGGGTFPGQFRTVAYYLPGATGWSSTHPGVSVVLWNPLIQTADGSFGISNNQFGFNISGTANIPIVVEACTNLGRPVWTPLQTLKLTNGLFYFNEPAQINNSGRYYRIGSQ